MMRLRLSHLSHMVIYRYHYISDIYLLQLAFVDNIIYVKMFQILNYIAMNILQPLVSFADMKTHFLDIDYILEMVHVMQYAKGMLKDKNSAGSEVYWRGYDYSNYEYSRQPWERQAYRMQESLLIKYKEWSKNGNRNT